MTVKQPFVKKIFHQTRRKLASFWIKRMRVHQIAITGSQGKTNTTYMIHKMLTALGKTIKTDIKLDTIYNVPITALKVRPWHKFVVWELGVDHPREMNLHLEIAHPEVAIITGISPVHTDREHMGSLDALIREKRKLIEILPKNGYAILNYDDPHVRKMASSTKAHVLFYGTDPNKCDVWVDNIQVSMQGVKAILHDKNKSFPIETSLIGKQHVYTIMASYLVGKLYDLKEDKFIKKIKEVTPLKGRMSIEKGYNDTTILNDALRSNPSSAAFGLKTFDEIEFKGKKMAILADMGELEKPKEEHQKLGKLLADLKLDRIVCIGTYQEYTYKEALEKGVSKDVIFWAHNVFEAVEYVKPYLTKNTFVYIKGSLYRRLDRIFGLIKGIKPMCNHKDCIYYNPSRTCDPSKCTITTHIHHDDTHV